MKERSFGRARAKRTNGRAHRQTDAWKTSAWTKKTSDFCLPPQIVTSTNHYLHKLLPPQILTSTDLQILREKLSRGKKNLCLCGGKSPTPCVFTVKLILTSTDKFKKTSCVKNFPRLRRVPVCPRPVCPCARPFDCSHAPPSPRSSVRPPI